jgi:hypothetical protein
MEQTIEYFNCGENKFTTKSEEDIFLKNCSEYFKINCRKNPGKISEKSVMEKIKKYGRECICKKISCDWLKNKKYIIPDCITDYFIIEVKTLRYFNSMGKIGNQGTAPEKIDSVFRKYCGIREKYNKTVLVVICADMQNNSDVRMYLDAYEKGEFNNNILVETIYEKFKNDIIFVRYQNLEKYIGINKQDNDK